MIRELASRVPIDKLIGETFRLKGVNRWRRGIEHDSLVVDLEKNVFYWNSVGIRGNALDWLTKIQGLSYRDALGELQRLSGLPFTNVLEAIDKPTPLYPKLLNTFFELGKHYREYWYQRGYTDETINYFKLGYTGKAFVIPIIVDGILMNFLCRIGSGENKRVWNWSSGRPTYPFNVDNQKSKYVFLMEGPPDVMAMHQIGLPAISRTGGLSTWKQEWNKYIIKFNSVYILYDNDEAGIVGAGRVANKFLNRGNVLYWPAGFPDKYDVNKCMLQYGEEKTKRIITEAMLPNAVHAKEVDRWRHTIGYSKLNEVRTEIERRARCIL